MKGLFRGFCPKDNGTQTILLNGKEIKGEWVEGNYVHRTQFYGEDFPCDDHFILSGGEFHCSYYEDHEIIPETLGEAVRGVTDINGRQIFEGDVIADGYSTWKVKYNDEHSGFSAYFFDCEQRKINEEMAKRFEIIGTIFDEKFEQSIERYHFRKKCGRLNI